MEVIEAHRTLESIMQAPLPLASHTPVIDALHTSERCGMHHFLLLEGDHALGVVCTCDLEDVALEAPVRDALVRSAVTLDVASSIDDAARRMSDEVVGSVLVTREGQAVGLVTREDVLRANGDTDLPLTCGSCGASSHLKHDPARGLLCLDCRSHSMPATADDEVGGSG